MTQPTRNSSTKDGSIKENSSIDSSSIKSLMMDSLVRDGRIELGSDRIRLRQWLPEDYSLFASMNADADVMEHFPATLSRSESDLLATRLHDHISCNGWGLWALEELSGGNFIGFTGLNETPPGLPFSPAVEIGWRLAKKYWGKGYASEAAALVLDFAFSELRVAEVVSFTSVTNKKSLTVMKRLGMINSQRNFKHPSLPAGHPLEEHLLYTIKASQWKSVSQQVRK
jgi:ribosomal-protein-alanine N-acetyltransferase